MKKYLGLCLIGAFLVACGGQQSSENNESPIPELENFAPIELKGKQLIAESGCLSCHKEREKLIGPAYADVAKKYENTPENISLLGGKIITGGKGVWGEIPMTPHPQISQENAEEMVKYIFTLTP
ncbi:c-type cytochrome [Pedobacter cryophilus]|uniref:C-type cytochrome n=1 Tax=Pedobacter cryophilus TaxID=2571271 RepID=A0A4U1C529_9SPHI|nr:c-type cytochrome [Pedobacter cryophilus]TKC00479.1 c-type cytochrome [Pedobacter cryophilus]